MLVDYELNRQLLSYTEEFNHQKYFYSSKIKLLCSYVYTMYRFRKLREGGKQVVDCTAPRNDRILDTKSHPKHADLKTSI